MLYSAFGTLLFLYDLVFAGGRAAAATPYPEGPGLYVLGAVLFPVAVVGITIGVGMVRRHLRTIQWGVRAYFWASLGLFVFDLSQILLEVATRRAGGLP